MILLDDVYKKVRLCEGDTNTTTEKKQYKKPRIYHRSLITPARCPRHNTGGCYQYRNHN